MLPPSVVNPSGRRANIEVIRSFIYPAAFDPPDILRKSVPGHVSFPATPATPISFDSRNVGVPPEVDPVIGTDGYFIDLNLAPEVVEFEG